MKKLIIILPLLFFFLLSTHRPAAAQDGACPPYTIDGGSLAGYYPEDMIACANEGLLSQWTVIADDGFPCGQVMYWDHRILQPYDATQSEILFYVPPAAWYYGQLPRIKLLISTKPTWSYFSTDAPSLDDALLGIYYFPESGDYYSSNLRSLSEYAKVTTYSANASLGARYYYNVYFINEVLLADEPTGGMFAIIVFYGDNDHMDFAVSSVQISNYNDTFPDHCPIPNASNPDPTVFPTPTVEATWTPDGNTPTPITTPFPTSSYATVQPTATPTPFTFVTVPAIPSPTSIPPLRLNDLSFTTPVMPTIPTLQFSSSSGPTVVPGSIPDLGDGIELMVTRWFTSTQYSVGLTDTLPITYTEAPTGSLVYQGPYAPSLEVPENEGTVTGAIMQIPSYFGASIGYLKMPFVLMPHFTTLLGGVYVLFSIMMFTMMLKYGLKIGLALVNWIIRIIELIPGM